MQHNHLERSIINIVGRIEAIKEQIIQSEDHDERDNLVKRLNQLYIMRSYYIQLIYKR